jgi:hypothetical protein
MQCGGFSWWINYVVLLLSFDEIQAIGLNDFPPVVSAIRAGIGKKKKRGAGTRDFGSCRIAAIRPYQTRHPAEVAT